MSNQNNQPEMELNEIIQVRHDKLKELKDEGRDPFVITKFDRTHSSSDISDGYTTEERIIEVRGEQKIVTAKISPLNGKNV